MPDPLSDPMLSPLGASPAAVKAPRWQAVVNAPNDAVAPGGRRHHLYRSGLRRPYHQISLDQPQAVGNDAIEPMPRGPGRPPARRHKLAWLWPSAPADPASLVQPDYGWSAVPSLPPACVNLCPARASRGLTSMVDETPLAGGKFS